MANKFDLSAKEYGYLGAFRKAEVLDAGHLCIEPEIPLGLHETEQEFFKNGGTEAKARDNYGKPPKK